MVAEGGLSVWAGIAAHSLSLEGGFGTEHVDVPAG